MVMYGACQPPTTMISRACSDGAADPDHRDDPAGLGGVIGEPGQRSHVVVPQPIPLGTVLDDRRRRAGPLVVDFEIDLRLSLEVMDPGRVLLRPTGRPRDDVVVAVAVVGQDRTSI